MQRHRIRSIVILIVTFAIVMGGCQKDVAVKVEPRANIWFENRQHQNPTWKGEESGSIVLGRAR